MNKLECTLPSQGLYRHRTYKYIVQALGDKAGIVVADHNDLSPEGQARIPNTCYLKGFFSNAWVVWTNTDIWEKLEPHEVVITLSETSTTISTIPEIQIIEVDKRKITI